MLAKDNKDIEKAVEKLKYVSADDVERFRIDQIEKARMDYDARMKMNYDQGREEGREEGKEEAVTEMVLKLIGRIDDDELSKVSGLSLDEIRILRNQKN